MIDAKSIKHRGLAELYKTGGSRRVGQNLVDRVVEDMTILDSITSLNELRTLNVGLHQLKGTRRGTWAIDVNGPWRLTFKFKEGTVYDLTLEQYH